MDRYKNVMPNARIENRPGQGQTQITMLFELERHVDERYPRAYEAARRVGIVILPTADVTQPGSIICQTRDFVERDMSCD